MKTNDKIIYALARLTLESGESVSFKTLKASTGYASDDVSIALNDTMVEASVRDGIIQYRMSRTGLEFLAKQAVAEFTYQAFGLANKTTPLYHAASLATTGAKFGVDVEKLFMEGHSAARIEEIIDQAARDKADQVRQAEAKMRSPFEEAENLDALEPLGDQVGQALRAGQDTAFQDRQAIIQETEVENQSFDGTGFDEVIAGPTHTKRGGDGQ